MDQPESIEPSYGESAAAIEQDFATEYAEIDGAYSRTTQYAGLVRNELVNSAKARRDNRLRELNNQHGVTNAE